MDGSRAAGRGQLGPPFALQRNASIHGRALARTALIASKRVLSRDASGTLFFVAGQDNCSLAAQCAPAVIFSRGPSDMPGSQDEAGNLQAATDFMQRPRSAEANAPGGAFDDLLAAVPLQVLYERMAAAKTLP